MAHPISDGDVKRVGKHLSLNPEAVDLWYKKHGGRASFSDFVNRIIMEDVGYKPQKPPPPTSFDPEPDEFGNIFLDEKAWKYYKRYGMPPGKLSKKEREKAKKNFLSVWLGVAA